VIDLYTWTTPNGRKISIALEELGLAYEVHEVALNRGEQHAPGFLKISPNNKIPAIVDRDTGRAMMESGAILLYLARTSGRLMPSEEDAYWQAMEWLMWQMGSFGPMLGQAHQFLYYNPGKSPFAEERYSEEAQRLYRVLDGRLKGRECVAGDYSMADVAIFPWAARFPRHRVDLNDFPNVKRWYLEVAARPAVQRGYDVPERGEAIPMPG
jgi:GSH-dependent disulfide-bond oxidoreductase